VSRGGVAGRFAMLAARTSPRSLALLELKSALYEAVSARVPPHEAPNAERVIAAVRERGGDSLAHGVRDEIASMNRVEAAVVAGRRPRVAAADLARAERVVRRALEALGAPGAPARHDTAREIAAVPLRAAEARASQESRSTT
jgi:hypothetical protein